MNLKPLSPVNHVKAHHGNLFERFHHGIPDWAKGTGVGAASTAAGAAINNGNNGC